MYRLIKIKKVWICLFFNLFYNIGIITLKTEGSVKNSGIHSSGDHCCMRCMLDGYSSGTNFVLIYRQSTDRWVTRDRYT